MTCAGRPVEFTARCDCSAAACFFVVVVGEVPHMRGRASRLEFERGLTAALSSCLCVWLQGLAVALAVIGVAWFFSLKGGK